MTDIFSLEQGKRLFGYIAAGGTIGGIAGSTSASFLAPAIGVNGLFLCAAILLTCIALGILAIYAIVSHAGVQVGLDQSIGQSPLSGLFAILQSPYLLTIAIWVVLGNVVTTFLYLQQAELLARSFPLAAERAAFLYRVDAIVSVCAILMQLTVMAWLVTRFGVGIATATQGVAAVVGFFAFVVTPGLMTAVWAQGAVRATAFGISLPARHLLFSVVSIDEKYKSQSAIDTLAHRGGDAAGGAIYQWLSRGLGLEASILAMIGGGAAVMWATIAVMFTPMMRRRSDRGMSEGGR